MGRRHRTLSTPREIRIPEAEPLMFRRRQHWSRRYAGAMALLLGVAGIYGVISYSVSQRTREIGIRKALGAQNNEVTGMFVRQGALLAAIGIAFGITAAAILMRLMSTLLFGVKPFDPITYIGVSLVLVAAAALASYAPALRATNINPVDALRAE